MKINQVLKQLYKIMIEWSRESDYSKLIMNIMNIINLN